MENNLSIVKDTFKELPNNIEAEQAVIGSILVQNEIFDEINTVISFINFYDPMHQKISEQINNKEYEIRKLSTENKELYGSVKPTEISKLILENDKLDIKPSMIQPITEIKSIGKFKVKIILHSEVDSEITINVVSADTIQ